MSVILHTYGCLRAGLRDCYSSRLFRGVCKVVHCFLKVYLVANSIMSLSTLYVSLDGAETFQKVPLEFKLDTAVVFHATKVDHILAVDEFRKVSR